MNIQGLWAANKRAVLKRRNCYKFTAAVQPSWRNMIPPRQPCYQGPILDFLPLVSNRRLEGGMVKSRREVISFPDLLRTDQSNLHYVITCQECDRGGKCACPTYSEQSRPILSRTTSLRQVYDMTYEYSLKSLNFLAFM